MRKDDDMTWKEFKNRVIEILTDDSSDFLTDEECEKWKEQRKIGRAHV